MSEGSAREISLGDDFGDVAFKVNGATIEVHADGSVAAHTSGGVDVYTDAPVRLHPAANDDGPSTSSLAKPGDRIPDGTVYAGISPDTHKPIYATPGDAPLTYTFNEAGKYAARLDAHGHKDWRVPTKRELNVLFNNRAAVGGFDESGSGPGGWYWSSSQYSYYFSDGNQHHDYKTSDSSLRCVRG
jgi:hypothetical protein